MYKSTQETYEDIKGRARKNYGPFNTYQEIDKNIDRAIEEIAEEQKQILIKLFHRTAELKNIRNEMEELIEE